MYKYIYIYIYIHTYWSPSDMHTHPNTEQHLPQTSLQIRHCTYLIIAKVLLKNSAYEKEL